MKPRKKKKENDEKVKGEINKIRKKRKVEE